MKHAAIAGLVLVANFVGCALTDRAEQTGTKDSTSSQAQTALADKFFARRTGASATPSNTSTNQKFVYDAGIGGHITVDGSPSTPAPNQPTIAPGSTDVHGPIIEQAIKPDGTRVNRYALPATVQATEELSGSTSINGSTQDSGTSTYFWRQSTALNILGVAVAITLLVGVAYAVRRFVLADPALAAIVAGAESAIANKIASLHVANASSDDKATAANNATIAALQSQQVAIANARASGNPVAMHAAAANAMVVASSAASS